MKQALKYLVYQVLYPFLVVINFDKILRNLSEKKRLIIFFHGVATRDAFQINGRHMPIDQFEKLLQYFVDNFEVVSLEKICKLDDRGSGRKRIALTFDDGFLNNLEVALPLLEKYQLPATFFVSSICMESKEYVHPSDFLDLVKIKTAGNRIEIGSEIFTKSRNQLLNIRDGQSVYNFIEKLPLIELKTYLAVLEATRERASLVKNINEELYKLVSKDAVQKLASGRLVTVGSHGHLHVNLNMLSSEDIGEQLNYSKLSLEKYSHKPVECLAFPYGHFNETVIELAKNAGFAYLFAGGDVEKKYERVVFPRIGVSNMRNFAFNVLSINRGFRRFGF